MFVGYLVCRRVTLSVGPPDVVVGPDFFLSDAAAVGDRALLGALGALELIVVELRVENCRKDAGGGEVIAAVLTEGLLFVDGTFGRARVRREGTGRYVVLVPLRRRARHQAAQVIERVCLTRRRRVWYYCGQATFL